jgi:hypothetical protein
MSNLDTVVAAATGELLSYGTLPRNLLRKSSSGEDLGVEIGKVKKKGGGASIELVGGYPTRQCV